MPATIKTQQKIWLKIAEQKIVTITLDKNAFSFYDIISHDWRWNGGNYEIMIGDSVEDSRLIQKITL